VCMKGDKLEMPCGPRASSRAMIVSCWGRCLVTLGVLAARGSTDLTDTMLVFTIKGDSVRAKGVSN
jgi:hypothetical protein